MSVLEFDGIEKSFGGRPVLSGIYMKCEAGKVTGLLGRNGSGKSTLMKAVFGCLSTTFKSVRINNQPLMANYLREKRIGYLPQANWLPTDITVKQTLKHFSIDSERLMNSFPAFENWLKYPANNLSGGYRRILEICLLLFSEHEFILLDEPFSGLMPIHVEEIKLLIHSVKKEKGIVISDHLYRHVLTLADSIYLLSNGKTYLIKDQEELVSRGYLIEV